MQFFLRCSWSPHGSHLVCVPWLLCTGPCYTRRTFQQDGSEVQVTCGGGAFQAPEPSTRHDAWGSDDDSDERGSGGLHIPSQARTGVRLHVAMEGAKHVLLLLLVCARVRACVCVCVCVCVALPWSLQRGRQRWAVGRAPGHHDGGRHGYRAHPGHSFGGQRGQGQDGDLGFQRGPDGRLPGAYYKAKYGGRGRLTPEQRQQRLVRCLLAVRVHGCMVVFSWLEKEQRG